MSDRIRIVLGMNGKGDLRYLSSEGHDSSAGEGSVPCGIVSAALRSFIRLVLDRQGIEIKADLDQPGYYKLAIIAVPDDLRRWYDGVSETTVRVLRDAAFDFAGIIAIETILIQEE